MTNRALQNLGLVVCAGLLALGCKKKNQEPPEEQGSIFRDAGVSGPSRGSGGAGTTIVTRPGTGGGTAGTTTDPQPSTTGGEPTGAGTGAEPDQPPQIERRYKGCNDPQPVNRADPSTPEGTLYMVFEALLMEDDDAAFDRFYSLIDHEFQREVDARRYWFASARKDGGQYFQRLVYGPKNPSFDICETRKEGPTGIRIFVGKSPPVGSNPPYVLHKVGDKWLLKSFTPF